MKKEGKWGIKVVLAIVLVVLVAVWLFRVQAVTDAIKIEKEEAAICRIEAYEKKGVDLSRSAAEIMAKEDIEALLKRLGESLVRFDGLWLTDIIEYSQEQLYSIQFYEEDWAPASEWIYIVTDGRIYYQNRVYRIQKEDRQSCMELFAETIQKYETEE